MGSTSQKVTRQQGQVGYDQHDHTLGIREPRHPLYARPQAPRLLRQHQPQQGTPRTPRPYPPLPRRMRRRPLELLDKGTSNPEAKGPPALRTPTDTAGADSRRAGTLPYLPTGVLQCRFRTGTLPARCLLDARQCHAGQPEAVRKRHELRHPVPFSATCHTMEAMERYASAHIAGEELMRRGAQ